MTRASTIYEYKARQVKLHEDGFINPNYSSETIAKWKAELIEREARKKQSLKDDKKRDKKRKLRKKEGVKELTDDVIDDATYFDIDTEKFIAIEMNKIGFDGKGLRKECHQEEGGFQCPYCLKVILENSDGNWLQKCDHLIYAQTEIEGEVYLSKELKKYLVHKKADVKKILQNKEENKRINIAKLIDSKKFKEYIRYVDSGSGRWTTFIGLALNPKELFKDIK